MPGGTGRTGETGGWGPLNQHNQRVNMDHTITHCIRSLHFVPWGGTVADINMYYLSLLLGLG